MGWRGWFIAFTMGRLLTTVIILLSMYGVTTLLIVTDTIAAAFWGHYLTAMDFIMGFAFSQLFLSVIYAMGSLKCFLKSTKRAEILYRIVLFTESRVLWISLIGAVCNASYNTFRALA